MAHLNIFLAKVRNFFQSAKRIKTAYEAWGIRVAAFILKLKLENVADTQANQSNLATYKQSSSYL